MAKKKGKYAPTSDSMPFDFDNSGTGILSNLEIRTGTFQLNSVKDSEGENRPLSRPQSPMAKQNLPDLVTDKFKMTPEEVLAYFARLEQAGQRLKDPSDDIETIFNKIQVWK